MKLLVLLLLPLSLLANETTYYSDDLVGRRMANGKRFSQSKMTCAVKNYRFGTVLKVTYKHKYIYVVVTDRPDSLTDLDLTKTAFKKLAPLKVGRLYNVKIQPIKS